MYLRLAFDNIDEGYLISKEDLTIVYANTSLYQIFDMSAEAVLQQPLHMVLEHITQKKLEAQLRFCFEQQQSLNIEFEYSPTSTWYSAEIFPFDKGLSVRLRDITIYKEAHEEVLKSRRLYAFISEVNELILRAKTEDEIYASLCHIAVETGGFLMSWTGIPDLFTRKVVPHSYAGYGTDYLSRIQSISLADEPAGHGPVGTAMRTGKPVFCNDIEHDPMMLVWRDEALKRGFKSAIAIPLFTNGRVAALLTLYASVPNYFAHEEVSLLVQVSKNISYALDALQNDKRRYAAEQQLQKVSRAVEQSSTSIVITDAEGNIEYVNPAFCKISGYSVEEVIGKNPRILKTGYTRPEEYSQMWDDITHLRDWRGEFCNKSKYGEIFWESAVISPITNDAGVITHYVAVKENITEMKKLEESQYALVNIIENSSAYVAMSDLNLNLTYANQAIKDVLEITEDDLKKAVNIDDFIPDSTPRATRDAVANQLNKEGKWVGEYCFRSRSGKEIHVCMVAILHKYADGSPSHYSATAVDITRVKEKENQLRQLNMELRELSLHLQQLSEIEKKNIAREIHDEMGQQLTALKFDAKWLKRHLADLPEQAEERLNNIIDNANELSSSFRRIHASLHPNILEDLGLQSSLEWLVNNFSQKTNIPVDFDCKIEPHVFDSAINITIYRVAQECLTNIMRYAQATRVIFTLSIQHNKLVLEISDNGVGFDYRAIDTKQHHGILGMRERLLSVNGVLKISSTKRAGTRVEARIPLNPPPQQKLLSSPVLLTAIS